MLSSTIMASSTGLDSPNSSKKSQKSKLSLSATEPLKSLRNTRRDYSTSAQTLTRKSKKGKMTSQNKTINPRRTSTVNSIKMKTMMKISMTTFATTLTRVLMTTY